MYRTRRLRLLDVVLRRYVAMLEDLPPKSPEHADIQSRVSYLRRAISAESSTTQETAHVR